ncbi:hypothetical protein niasHT_005719 [Heterodera trifolii]|uniref:Uncharacterized protein n=1 Tax=Heterodera trifolii TaxID=157864 RepID=A0ABD2LYQ5_9BILA
MEMVNFGQKALPIPQIQLPRKVTGFQTASRSEFSPPFAPICLHQLSTTAHRCRVGLVPFFDAIFPEFPCDDNATASDGHVLAKMVFHSGFKTAFALGLGFPRVNFIVVIWFPSYFDDFVVPFEQINEMTREQLALSLIDDCMKRMNINNQCFMACPLSNCAEMKANGQNGKQKRFTGIF